MCHKTASLVARALEVAGIATVVVGTMHTPLERAPRGLVTPYRDAPFGPPHAEDVHREVMRQALEMLRSEREHVVKRAETLPLLGRT